MEAEEKVFFFTHGSHRLLIACECQLCAPHCRKIFLFITCISSFFTGILDREVPARTTVTGPDGVPEPASTESPPQLPVVTISECGDSSVTEEPTKGESPSAPTASVWPSSDTSSESLSKSDHAFYHHDFLDTSARKYFLQAGTKFFHLNVEVTPQEEGASEDVNEKMKYEPLPDGSKMFTFNLHFRLSSFEKPNLNEMYLDVIHTLQHLTNFEQLDQSQEYMKAIARFMESAFFSIDRIDSASLEAMLHFTKMIKVRHVFPEGEAVFIGRSKHKEETPNAEIPQPVITVHTDLENGLSSSSHASNPDVNSGADLQKLSTKKDASDASEGQQHQISQNQEQQQPLEQQCELQSDSVDSPSIHSSDQSSSGSGTSSESFNTASTLSETQSSITENIIRHEIRQKFDESLARNLKSQSIEKSNLDQSLTSSSSSSSSTSSSTSQEAVLEKEEQHTQRDKDEF